MIVLVSQALQRSVPRTDHLFVFENGKLCYDDNPPPVDVETLAIRCLLPYDVSTLVGYKGSECLN